MPEDSCYCHFYRLLGPLDSLRQVLHSTSNAQHQRTNALQGSLGRRVPGHGVAAHQSFQYVAS